MEQAVQRLGRHLAIEDGIGAGNGRQSSFIELNDNLDLKAHYNPGEGKPRDVAGAIVDYLTTRC